MKTLKRKSFKHLTQYERDRIEKLRFHRTSLVDIAKILGRDKGTISREIKKHAKGTLRVEMVYSRVPVIGETIFIFNKKARRFLDVSVKRVKHFPAEYIQQNNRTVDAEVVCEEYDCNWHLGGYEAIKELWSHMVY